MKKVLIALIAFAFATIVFAQEKSADGNSAVDMSARPDNHPTRNQAANPAALPAKPDDHPTRIQAADPAAMPAKPDDHPTRIQATDPAAKPDDHPTKQ